MVRNTYNVWEAYTYGDLTEGRGHKVTIGYFRHQKDARRAAEGQGVMGTNAQVEQASVEMIVYESYEEYTGETLERLRRQALSKLTPKERQALGF